MFVDEVTVQLKAGDGGRGCMSFRREKFEPRGGPNGGNGGKGGNVVLVGDENTSDLTDYRFVPHASAQNGQPGRGSSMHGARGKDARLRLPLGTVVYQPDTGEVVTEVTHHGEEILLLEGGRGGLGNEAYKSSVNQAPRQTTPGLPGEEGAFRLVLKTIADGGLVGYPNAGKSSLLNILTNATPKVGHYPFTTLHPTVGVIEYNDTWERLTLADIPGLIEGASENRGLGHRFLRHIERCRVLVFVLDMGATDDRDPIKDFVQLQEELRLYNAEMLDKPRLIVANKMDEEPPAAEYLARLRATCRDTTIVPVSCLSDEGIPELLEAYRTLVKAASVAG